jgi:hypothetical protein
VRLSLGQRDIDVENGRGRRARHHDPARVAAVDGPDELIMTFDRDGQRALVHHDTGGHPTR